MHWPISWKQSLLTTGWFCLLILGAAAAFAQSQGRLRLPGLPPTAHVYVDAKPVVVRNDSLSLPSGWHHIQVEKQDKSGLQAYRRFVQVIADKTAEMRIVWHPVRLAIGPDGRANYSPPGISGPSGEPGPSARPYKPLPANADLAMLRPPLQEARDILVSDFEAQVQDALNGLSHLAAPVYLYLPGPPFAEPPGDSGAVGPNGQPGIPAEVRLIQASTGVPLQDRMEQSLGLPEMQRTLAALQARLQSLFRARQFYIPITPETVQVLTPEWKTALDQEWKERKAKVPEEFHGADYPSHLDWTKQDRFCSLFGKM